MAKFLFRSDAGEGLAIARRVESEGHDVRMWIRDPKMARVGDGLINKTNDIAAVKWADVIAFDSHNHGLAAEAELWSKTKPVIGSSAFADKLEHKRVFGIDTMEQLGVVVPDFKAFKGPRAFDQARRFLLGQEDENGWVFKPNVDTIRTHLARDTEEMVRMLDYFERVFKEEKATPDFLLEWRLTGIEVEIEGWFNGTEFGLLNWTIEEQRFFDNDLGELTGCSGNVVWACPSVSNVLAEDMLLPLADVLKGKYRGPVAINTLVLEDGVPSFLEFSVRFGYSAIFSLMELVDNMGELLLQCATDEPITVDIRKDVFAIGLRATVPPYPAAAKEGAIEGLPVFGFDPRVVDRHMSPVGVRVANARGDVETTGVDSVVMEITQTGETIPLAKERLYREAAKLHVPNLRYRLDIGTTAKEDFDKLKEMEIVEGPTTSLPWET